MRIISIDGGGYLGLATASFLQVFEHRHGTTGLPPFANGSRDGGQE
jgi:hypothetical protein